MTEPAPGPPAHSGSGGPFPVLAVLQQDLAAGTLTSAGLLPDYDKCQAYIADVHSAFRSGS
jgi:hypothetical protein